MQEEKFSIFVPIEIEKSEKKGEERYSNMKFKGIASNPNKGLDSQNQWLDPSGFQLDQFLQKGFINFHHLWKNKPTAIIGEPTKAHITKSNELYIEGYLYPDSQLARDVYDAAEIMEKNSKTRRMGFSIEGIPLEKDPNNENIIKKAKITQVAITPTPVCPGTQMDIVKGGIDNLKFENQEGTEFILDIVENGVRYTIDNNLELTKAMVAGDITGKDTTDKVLTQEPLKEESVDQGDRKIKKKKKKEELSKGEMYYKLITEHQLDFESCKRVIDLAVAIDSTK